MKIIWWVLAVIGVVGLMLAWRGLGTSATDPDPLAGAKGPWKVEVVLYDHPMAGSVAVGDATLLEDDTLIVPISVAWRGPFVGHDWYEVEDALRLHLVSRDRGMSWEAHPKPGQGDRRHADENGHLQDLLGRGFVKSFKLKDGMRLRISWLGYQQHPMEELARWEEAGYWIYLIPERELFATTGGFVVETSTDDGRTWRSREIDLPHLAFLAGYGMATARMLSDGTIIMPVFGYLTRRHKTYACSVIRSEDGGRTWELITVAQDERPQAVADSDIPSGTLWSAFPEAMGFDEAQVIETRKPGRLVLIVEESFSKNLYSSVSEDYGRTWSRPQKTGMRGNTPLLIRLQSGALACAFTQRWVEGGFRVCLSYDDGATWNTDEPIILRDTNARTNGQCLWNLVQFSDGTLFASGWATKRGCGGGEEDEVSYAVGFRFTENFRTPLRISRLPIAPEQ